MCLFVVDGAVVELLGGKDVDKERLLEGRDCPNPLK
jgi:hypothetical protein